MSYDIPAILYTASTWILPALLAITLHEAAHGLVAWYLGDDTAYRAGRVTFNPLKHIDPFGTVILPAILIASPLPFVFGYAKPVPIAVGRLGRPKRDMVYVASAGPGINLLLALASAILLHVASWFPGAFGEWLILNLYHSILLNLLLAVFNMLPLPPLDGGRVAVGLLPHELAFRLARIEPYGLLILVGLLFLLPYLGSQIGVDVNLLKWLVWEPVKWLLPYFMALGGLSTGTAL